MATEIEQLYREHRAGLVRLVERELHDHHDAEDVVQTAFIDAQRALERGTTPRHPRAWLAAIALNAGRRLRRRRVNAEPLEEYAVEEASGVPEIRTALASLPKEQREAVVYRDLLGLSYGETAEQMGKSVNAVTMLLHRGRKGLRQALGVTTGGIWLWRWLRRAGTPQVAVAKGAAAVVVAGGLATTGVVAARVVAPIGSEAAAAAAATRSGGAPRLQLAPRHPRRDAASGARSVAAATQGSSRAAAAASVSSSTAEKASGPSPSTLPVSPVSLPALSAPTPPVTVSATVAVSTPIATVSVTTPTSATVTTPITTVTVPIP